MDYIEYARQMRENAIRDESGAIRCSPELWEQIASNIESIDTTPEVARMTCKDCIHYDVCEIHDDNEFPSEEIKKFDCPRFKNKANYVEVVRCKDCEYYVPLGDAYEHKGKKAMHCWMWAKCTGDNYYCADGMRKEKDNG